MNGDGMVVRVGAYRTKLASCATVTVVTGIPEENWVCEPRAKEKGM